MMRALLLTTAIVAGLATTAHAADITVTGYDLSDPVGFGAGTVNGYNYYDGPITLHVVDNTTQVQSDILAYCADLNHFLQSGAGYNYAPLTEDGLGNALTMAESGRLGRLASAGFAALQTNDLPGAAAAQLLIWSLEYHVAPSSFASQSIHDDFDALSLLSFGPIGWATALVPDGGWPATGSASQQMVIGFSNAVPEASTWAMAGIGFAGVAGLGLFNRRKAPRFIEA
jgi:hypothetical protein